MIHEQRRYLYPVERMETREVSGTRQFESIEIDPEVVDPEDVEMLQDLVLAAVNGALKLSDDRTNEAMSKLQGMG